MPNDHILRDIDRAIDFNFIYDEVKDLYSSDIGRPSVDPVVLFKIILIQYTFGIRSMRSQTIERVFADAKEKHFMRYTQLRGKAKLKMQVLLTFACMNLKKLASWKKKNGLLSPILGCIFEKLLKLNENLTRYWKFVFPIPRLSTVWTAYKDFYRLFFTCKGYN